MKVNFKLAHKGLALVSVFLLFELAFLTSLAWLVEETRREGAKQARSKEIAGKICHAFRTIQETVDEIQKIRGMELDEPSKISFKRRELVLRQELDELNKAVRRYPTYRDKVEEVVHMVKKALRMVEIAFGLDNNSMDQAQRMVMMANVAGTFSQAKFETTLIDDVYDVLQAHKRMLAKGTDVQQQLRSRIELLLAFMVLLNVGLAVALGAVFLSGIANRIFILTDNSSRYAKGLAFNPPLKGSDELGQFDESFRRMATALTEAGRKERAIIENANTVICSLDKNGSFVKVNPACQRVWGYEEEQLIGKSLSDFIVPSEKSKYNNALQEGIEEKKQEFETRIVKGDASEIDVLWTAQWMKEENNLYCVFHDITERKRAENDLKASEQRLVALLDNMVVGLLISTHEGVIESSNKQLNSITNYDESELSSKKVQILLGTQKSLAPTAAGSSIELELRDKNGAEVPVELAVTEFNSAEGPRLLTNVIDISERRAIERTKQEFLAMVSHDLRTPLSSVSAYLELLAAGLYGKLSPEQAKGAEEASQQAFRLLALISDLLEITRMETSKLDLKVKSVSLEELIESVMIESDDLAEERGVKIEYDLEDADFQADFTRLKRVVNNLITNAINASPSGKKVVVKTINHGSSVEAIVSDRGVTIEESEKASMFDRLSRNKSEKLKEREGSGLGLPICKAIVEQHGGSIGIESGPENGTSFWIRIPKRKPGEIT